MTSAQLKRLASERSALMIATKKYHENPESDENCYFMEDTDSADLRKFSVFLRGPPNTPYAGGCFKLNFDIPVDFPFVAPHVKFGTRIYHPNIDDKGNICLDTLSKAAWSPSHYVGTVIITIMALLESPNPADPLSPAIAAEFTKDYLAFLKNATANTKTYTSSSKDPHRQYMTEEQMLEKSKETMTCPIKAD